jgi:threonine dehydratase
LDLPTLAELEAAADLIRPFVPPTPQFVWPLLFRRVGVELWVKHENHTPIGAFKVRGGLVYLHDVRAQLANRPGVIAATRGNHGQSVAFAARQFKVKALVVVPEGNSLEKNAAMQAWGAELIVHGHDFQASLEHTQQRAASEGWHFFPSFHRCLVAGVGTAALEFFRAAPDLDVVYVPIGLGSGICGALAARRALNLRASIVGVVAERAPCYALSFAAGKPVSTQRADTFADGLACRVVNAEALELIRAGAERIVTVSENEIEEAIRIYFSDTHQVAEGAGAAALAAALKERQQLQRQKVGVILSGGNIDRDLYRRILAHHAPRTK